ncbi:hypothetical protein [Leptospira dzoumogneensis]|uniref:Lipoprotein n=1 Tax=Leptospira dzoumogneensis TaxID=2484904 RepID=A0A4Z1ARY4_9LEPT|nr:hypothetical protein [Leptospira dzoumogneensis]TGN03027.1 hypothetical protein EHR06_03190 [Leptospira dzoumogneensis]
MNWLLSKLILTFVVVFLSCAKNEYLKDQFFSNNAVPSHLTISLSDNSSENYGSLLVDLFQLNDQGSNTSLNEVRNKILEVSQEGVKVPLSPGKYNGSLRLRGGNWENIKTNISFDITGLGLSSGVVCHSEEVTVGYTVYQNIVCPPVITAPGKNPILKIEISPDYRSYLEASIVLFLFFRNPTQANLRFLKVSLIPG